MKRPERCVDHPLPLASRLSRRKTKFYSPSVPPKACYGATFTFTFITSVSQLVRNLWIVFCQTNYVSYYSLGSYRYSDCLRVWSQRFGPRNRQVFIIGHHIHIDFMTLPSSLLFSGYFLGYVRKSPNIIFLLWFTLRRRRHQPIQHLHIG
jgi:hypothetical protein